ncbi:ras GTPase-activating protein 1 [Eurytemora carolleeae]|uniref:ras GTPase-activating protein 1 n=1 Tax=Eurytemora carolleeae TaxID=1294199 RepID=UPI000C77F079|nr:ras GTPase-activating protein 1 [Eurytemora carolleeae]|eukprot:XP_023333542.1 ras GTPase-activating protein 1-like [Eurytemora affinis]
MMDPEDQDQERTEILSAPSEKEWYHGRLDRFQSEERLRLTEKHGSYLVRESDRKPGSYVLSYFGQTGINHFRVTAVCGDFYIGGRQFDSLQDLIGYYTHISDLLKHERLQHPVPPPEPVNDKKRMVAILPYTKMPDTDEITFQKGDIFFVHNDLGDGWLWVTGHRTGEQGLVFKVKEVVQLSLSSSSTNFAPHNPLFYKNEAVDLLVRAGPGSFLVRPSDNSPGDYSLFFHINNQIQRFRIEKKGVKYVMGGRTFDCLNAVIDRYKTEQIVEGFTLGHHVKKQSCEDDGSFPTRQEEPEESAAEKIYASLRECREQADPKRQKGVKMQGFLNKKKEQKEKWKSQYFVLKQEGSDCHMYIYEHPKRTKPKGLIDLSCAYMYMVHESLFDKRNVFQLVERALPCLATTTYLSAETASELEDWFTAIKPLCVPQMVRSPKVAKLREVRTLFLSISEAHRLPLKLVPNPYCVISFNQVRIAKTKVKLGPDPVFDEEFELDDIPPDVFTVTVTVFNKAKRGKDTEVAELILELSNVRNSEDIEDWFSLSGVTPIGEWGTIRLRTRYLHDLIMPQDEYSPLKELILNPLLEVVVSLADICHTDRLPLASSLLRIFRFEKKEADLLASLSQLEIEREEETSTLFRGASLTTTLMDLYMKSVCQDFLHTALFPTIHRILETRQSCELNPSKIESPNEACANAEFLLQVLDDITESIFMSSEACPRTLRYICHCLQRDVQARWPNERLVKTRVVSGFIFLRLLCPAILNPRQFGLLSDPVPPAAMRSFVMIAKCLQNLANLVEFGGKETYMEVVNPFILKNKERMVVFLDHLSSVRERPYPDEDRVKGDPARDLATVHHVCENHLSELVDISKEMNSIKTLVTVTEMLSKHKQKYTEMLGS